MCKLAGYRKFAIALLFWGSGSGLCLLGRMSGGEFVTLASIVTGLYGLANVASNLQKITVVR